MRFYEKYNNCLQQEKPFWIEFEKTQVCNYYQNEFLQTCEGKKENTKFDLTKYFKEIFLEEKEGSFIPDLLLLNDQKHKIFIEIAVTHQATKEKIQSKYRIIEIKVETEKDLELIDNQHLIEGEKILFLNFKRELLGDFCRGNCIKGIKPYDSCLLLYNFFVVFNNGKSRIIKETLTDIHNKLETKLILYYDMILFDDSDSRLNIIFIDKVVEAYSKKIQIKNCYLCRYHGVNTYNYNSTPIFCKFLKKPCNSNEAATCEYYRVDPQVFPSNVNPQVSQPTNEDETRCLETPSIATSNHRKFEEAKKLIHPTFGEGIIIEIVVDDVAKVKFPNIGIKLIYLPNCLPVAES